jgi:hypothetical protein
VLWDVMLCNMVGSYHCFRGMLPLHCHGTRVSYPEDGGRFPEMLVPLHQTVSHLISENNNIKFFFL